VKETVSDDRGSRSSVGSSFHRHDEATVIVIFKEDRAGGQARVALDEE